MADYLYGSARVRSLENAIVGRDRILRMAQSKNASEAYSVLEEAGVELLHDENGTVLREETLLEILKKAYTTVMALAPDSAALRLWLYPYDCNNVKAAIKGFVRGIDAKSMMFDFGTVSTDRIVGMVAGGHFEDLPAAMTRAANEALAAYSKTKNPQKIDLLLDRACYEDMLCAARMSGNDFVLDLVRMKIDLLNVSMTLRVLRMKSGETGGSLLRDALLEGGTIGVSELVSLYEKGEDVFWAQISRSGFDKLADRFFESDRTPSVLDRISDNLWMEKILDTKFIPMGLEVMVSFLLAHEYEVKNLRIVLSGKEAGLPVNTICERIRESYV